VPATEWWKQKRAMLMCCSESCCSESSRPYPRMPGTSAAAYDSAACTPVLRSKITKIAPAIAKEVYY